MIHRHPSESGASGISHGSSGSSSAPKKWRLPILRKMPSIRMREDKSWNTRSTDTDFHDSLGLHHSETNTSFASEGQSSSNRQLRDIVQRMRTAPSGHKEVDAAYEVYSKHKDRASALCHAILQEEFRPRHMSNVTETLPRRDSSLESPSALYDQRSSFSGRSLSEVVTGSGGRSMHVHDSWLNAIRDWKNYLEVLEESFRTNLADTYRKFEQDATPEMVEAMFTSKRFRKEAVHRMRNASVTRVMSADPQFFPRYEIRFRNYERVKQELTDIRGLLQSGESGISPDRKVEEYTISTHGDTVLEFANIHLDTTDSEPVLRFRVSSHMLTETSPIFSQMFTGKHQSIHLYDDDDIHPYLPPAATKYICKDGTEAKLFRMPQIETNRLQCLEILLHAAHMHNEKVPKEVTFEQFVAIAECCMKYKCTSPLETIVENRWLPKWMHKGADDMPDGMLAISYAFGIRQLFMRMSKSAILNLVDDTELQSKPWSQKLKDKIWAVRCAKMAQVHACCTNTIQDYIRQPARHPADDIAPVTASELRTGQRISTPLPKQARTTMSSTPRCPKGSHWCDASNLGWMMLVYNEMNLLPQILRPNALSHLMEPQQHAPKSLAQVVEALRRVPSPVSPIHQGGVCDPIPAFRAAVNDIFNSVSGMTLFDVSGKSHGWAMSRHRASEPQEKVTWGLERMAVNDRAAHSVATEFPESVRLKVLSYIDDLDDLHSVAMTNRAFYETYKTHELYLMRKILRSGRIRAGRAPRYPILPRHISNAEEKVPKSVSDEMKETGHDVDHLSFTTEDDDESDMDDVESIDGTPAPSITNSLLMETKVRQAQTRHVEHQRRFRPSHGSVYDITPPSQTRPVVPPDGFIGAEDMVTFITATPSSVTPRQGSPVLSEGTASPKSNVVLNDYPYEPPLTDEEARRILWPDAEDDNHEDGHPTRASAIRPEDGLREKFRFGDKSFTEGLEDKSLALIHEEKQLLSEEDESTKKGEEDREITT